MLGLFSVPISTSPFHIIKHEHTLLFYALHQIPFILATALFVEEHRRRNILIVGAHSSSEHTCRRSNTAFSRFVLAY
ncbi:uncharacterized protein G2W53_012405 [Senna tora]|uniref:Uncharacterized protein n=1 Tax=Senna tora TaxID=362788 RepID=A0A834TXM3_9FABA|nr:uncharacterized protein G2W53_012405 [Senna tora]